MAGRSLSLEPRKVATRNPEIKVFDITEIEKHFAENIEFIKTQFQIAEDLINDGKNNEAAEIWRSQIVFLESAFDFYLHEIIKLGILCIFHDEWQPKTEKYKNLTFTMSEIEEALADNEDDEWLKKWINKKYASDTLMSFSAFKDVCNLLNLDYKAIADNVFYDRESTEKTIDKLKCRLNEIFFRRNRIVHQMDRQRENAERQDIKKEDVENFIIDLEKIVHATGQEIRKKGEV